MLLPKKQIVPQPAPKAIIHFVFWNESSKHKDVNLLGYVAHNVIAFPMAATKERPIIFGGN
jgi:hypothetical protein